MDVPAKTRRVAALKVVVLKKRLLLKVVAARISLGPKGHADRMLADRKANAVQRVIAAKGIVARISLALKMADARKGIGDRMLAAPRAAALRANVAKGIVVQKNDGRKEIVARMVRVVR